jgi:hypothetical protein
MATTTETQTQTGTCATHGAVQAERQLPKLTFPFLITAPMRYVAKRKPYRCPECGTPVTLRAPGQEPDELTAAKPHRP